MNTKIQQPTKQRKRSNFLYVIMSISLLCILPAASTTAEVIKENIPLQWCLVAKWFVFWAVGIRLFTAGLSQAANPEFTAREIFRFMSKDSYVVIRELGFANIALGAMGILSVINEHWRLLAAIISGIFFGFAALQHFSKKPDSSNEFVAMVYDTSVFVILIVFAVTAFPL
jgi:hypothetical protein